MVLPLLSRILLSDLPHIVPTSAVLGTPGWRVVPSSAGVDAVEPIAFFRIRGLRRVGVGYPHLVNAPLVMVSHGTSLPISFFGETNFVLSRVLAAFTPPQIVCHFGSRFRLPVDTPINPALNSPGFGQYPAADAQLDPVSPAAPPLRNACYNNR